jgi:hypothetical protein
MTPPPELTSWTLLFYIIIFLLPPYNRNTRLAVALGQQKLTIGSPLQSGESEKNLCLQRGKLNTFQTWVNDETFFLLDITPCSPLEVSQRFGETYRLHLQGRRVRKARNQQKQAAGQ